MTDREVMQQALEALEASIDVPCYGGHPKQEAAAAALRAQLEQPEQKQHQPWCDSVTKLLLSNPPQIPPCNCKQEPVTQPEQEPVALIRDGVLRWHIPNPHYSRPAWTAHGTHMLYVQPPQRKPLSDEQIMDIVDAQRAKILMDEARVGYRVARAIEKAHGIKGEA